MALIQLLRAYRNQNGAIAIFCFICLLLTLLVMAFIDPSYEETKPVIPVILGSGTINNDTIRMNGDIYILSEGEKIIVDKETSLFYPEEDDDFNGLSVTVVEFTGRDAGIKVFWGRNWTPKKIEEMFAHSLAWPWVALVALVFVAVFASLPIKLFNHDD